MNEDATAGQPEASKAIYSASNATDERQRKKSRYQYRDYCRSTSEPTISGWLKFLLKTEVDDG